MSDLIDSVVSNSKPTPSGMGRGRAQAVEQSIMVGDEGRVSDSRAAYTRRRPGAVSVSQGQSAGAGGAVSGNTNTVNIDLSESDYFFELQPFEIGQGDVAALPPGARLHAGRRYRLRVGLSKNPLRTLPGVETPAYKLRQWPFRISNEMSLCLRLDGVGPNVLDAVGEILPQRARLALDAAGDAQADFEFMVRKGYPLSFTILLEFYRGGDSQFPYPAAALELEIEGSEAPPPTPIGELLDLPAGVEPPVCTAILHVTPAGGGRLRLIGWAGGLPDSSLSLDLSEFAWVNLGACATVEEYSRRLNKKFNDYSLNDAAAVTSWFERALGLYGEGCGIVIVDETGHQIPWEMFRLGGGRYLGAEAEVVRWTEAQYGSQRAAERFANPRFVGRVSAYLHPDEVKEMDSLDTLNRLLPHYATQPAMLEHDLLPGEDEEQVGLVYLCYGGVLVYGDEGPSTVGLLRFKPYDSDVEIRFDVVSDMLEPRPIFFANAPYTGLILRSGQKLCGLARAVLRQVAASYIGALGPVGRSYAARFAQALLEEATSEGGVRVAEFLRRQRAAAAARVRQKLPMEEWERALGELSYPFLYVHYGHPQDWLKISRGAAALQSEGGDV